MSVAQKLIEFATADIHLLRALNRHGDDFSVSRKIDFQFRTTSKEKAETIASFVNDHYFGLATTAESDGQCEISVTVHMPIQLNLLLSVSGFMGCLAQLFELEYDGWSCASQKQ